MTARRFQWLADGIDPSDYVEHCLFPEGRNALWADTPPEESELRFCRHPRKGMVLFEIHGQHHTLVVYKPNACGIVFLQWLDTTPAPELRAVGENVVTDALDHEDRYSWVGFLHQEGA